MIQNSKRKMTGLTRDPESEVTLDPAFEGDGITESLLPPGFAREGSDLGPLTLDSLWRNENRLPAHAHLVVHVGGDSGADVLPRFDFLSDFDLDGNLGSDRHGPQKLDRHGHRDGSVAGEVPPEHFRDDAEHKYAVSDRLAESGVLRVLGVEMNRIVVSGHVGESLNVGCSDDAGCRETVAYLERVVRMCHGPEVNDLPDGNVRFATL